MFVSFNLSLSLSSPASFGIQVSCIYLHFIVVAENKKKVFMYPYLTIFFFFMNDKL